MALPAARRCVFTFLLPALVAALPASSAEDGARREQQPRAAQVESPPAQTALLSSPAAAEPAETRPDREKLKAAIAAYRRGALAEGDALAGSVAVPAERALLEWVAIRSGVTLPFARLSAFLRDNPNYPATPLVRRRAEEALIAEKKGPAAIRAFFHGREPVSPAGRVALALALKDEGRKGEAETLIRATWRRDHLASALEKIVLAAFDDVLTRDDHRLRTERYLFRENGEAALRNAARVSADYVALARLRLASAKARQPLAERTVTALPAAVKGDISFAFLRAQQARRADKPAEAAKILAGITRDPAQLGDGDGWWLERRVIVRKLLDAGDAEKAYEVAAGHGAEDDAERVDAEWHAGFVALRFRNAAAVALDHFRAAGLIAQAPISVSRAAYWEGRALEALDRHEEARTAYRRAAEHPIAYYGQLARARLGFSDLPLRSSSPAPLDELPAHRGVTLLYEIGERELATQMLTDLAQRLHTANALETVAELARREADPKALLAIGKMALQRGFPLDTAAFPTSGVPEFDVLGDPMERAIVHAIARQESAFDPSAMSHAGARGLMQMMPATARETARRANLPFDWARLGQDAHYSARMGAAHLNDLLTEWRGSYVLTFAAYNAGSGNVKKWIAAYGDPRRPDVDAVDWVERIPFYETRNYVQRVMENLQVYRQRLDQRTAYLIDHDLKRGGRRE